VLKQAFIGDEEFVEWARQRAAKVSAVQGQYSLKHIAAAVSNVSGVGAEQMKRPQQNNEAVKRSRELLSYVSRRHSDVGLGELARYLQVKELSTPCHAVTRAEERLKKDQEFRRQLERVLRKLGHSAMQA
jgi:chromosomal replication initiation ATPase DnaA